MKYPSAKVVNYLSILMFLGCAEPEVSTPISGEDAVQTEGGDNLSTAVTDTSSPEKDGESERLDIAESDDVQGEIEIDGSVSIGDASISADASTMEDIAPDSLIPEEEMDITPAGPDTEVAWGPKPEIVDIETSALENWGLGAQIRVQADNATSVETLVTGPSEDFFLPASSVAKTSVEGEFRVMVLGLQASTNYTFQVTAIGPNGQSSDVVEQQWTTEPLPEKFSKLTWTATENHSSELEGLISFSVADVTPNVPLPSKSGFLVIVDMAGTVRGFKAWPTQQVYARRTPTGSWLSMQGKKSIREWGIDGELLWELSAEEAEVDSFHHELLRLPNKRIAVLGSRLKAVSGYPEGTLDVVADTIMEVDPEDLPVEPLWDFFDVLDPYRITGSFSTSYWAGVYNGVSTDPRDWTHANSLFLTPDESSYIISIRNQNLVGQFARETGEIQWVLGKDDPVSIEDDNWPWLTLPQATRVPNHQHSASLTSAGTLMVYDNGSDIQTSYLVEYAIDPEALTAELIWSWTDQSLPYKVFSRNGGNAEAVPGGRALLTHSQLLKIPGDGGSPAFSLIQMVQKSGEETIKEWDLKVENPDESRSVRVYRAHYLSSIYAQ